MFALGSFKASIGNCREDFVARNHVATKTCLAIAALLVRVATIAATCRKSGRKSFTEF